MHDVHINGVHWNFHWIWYLFFVLSSVIQVIIVLNLLDSLHALLLSPPILHHFAHWKESKRINIYIFIYNIDTHTFIIIYSIEMTDYYTLSMSSGLMKLIHRLLPLCSPSEVICCLTGIYWIINYFFYLILKALNQCQLINLPHDFMLISFPQLLTLPFQHQVTCLFFFFFLHVASLKCLGQPRLRT